MKKSAKSLCRGLLTLTAAIIMFTFVKTAAHAETDEIVIDFSQGQSYTYYEKDLKEAYKKGIGTLTNAPVNMKNAIYTLLYASGLGLRLDSYTESHAPLHKESPFQTIYELDNRIYSSTQDVYYTLSAGNSKGTYIATITEDTKFNTDYISASQFIQDAKVLYGYQAINPSGKKYVKLKFLFKDPKSTYVVVDEKGNSSVVIPDTEFVENGCKYKVTGDDEVTFTGVANKKMKTIKIPDTVHHQIFTYRVTSIANKALSGNKNVKSIRIGRNVTRIGRSAFSKCKNLKKLRIYSKVITGIGKKALYKNSKKLVIWVPRERYSKYKKMLKKVTSNDVKILKLTD